MTHEEQIQRSEILAGAMAELVNNHHFAEFMNAVRTLRENTVQDLCSAEVVKNDRATCAAIGELSSYNSIIEIYEDYLSRRGQDNA